MRNVIELIGGLMMYVSVMIIGISVYMFAEKTGYPAVVFIFLAATGIFMYLHKESK